MKSERLIIALDLPAAAPALELADRLAGLVSFYKVGLELFAAAGPAVVDALKERGHRVFLDLKFFDIPETVARAARAVTRLRVDMFNLHLAGGTPLLEAAAAASRDEAARLGIDPPRLIGVTVLTSSGGREWRELGLAGTVGELVVKLAARARDAGLDGVVASPREAADLKRNFGPGFLVVSPGIRPAGAETGDQQRVLGPRAALEAGSDFLVVGRPVTRAFDPVDACRRIVEEMEGGGSPAPAP